MQEKSTGSHFCLKIITSHCITVQVQGYPSYFYRQRVPPPSQTKVKEVAMRGGLFPILCVNWTVKNPIAPKPTYTSRYYYYSTKDNSYCSKEKRL